MEDPVAAFVGAHEQGRTVTLRTSGTSGTTRRVVRSTGSWVSSFDHVTALTGMSPASRVWVPGPVTATMNLFALVHARLLGAAVTDGPCGATHAHLTPSALRQALDRGVAVRGMHVVVAGDRLARGLAARVRHLGGRSSHYYGAAELSFVAWGGHAGDLRPFPGVEVDVRAGEVWARSPYLCLGYEGPPGPLRTDPDGFATVGDRGRLEDGRLVLHGRSEEAVTTAGATVLVGDVEEELSRLTTAEVVVLGLPHPGLGQVVAAVLTDAGAVGPLRAAARSRLGGPYRPRLWFVVPAVPLTDAGKVDRAALRALVGAPHPGVRRLP